MRASVCRLPAPIVGCATLRLRGCVRLARLAPAESRPDLSAASPRFMGTQRSAALNCVEIV